MKMNKAIVCLALAFLMLVSLAACNKPNDPPSETTAAKPGETTVAPETTENPLDENGFLKDKLPGNLDFGNETVHILGWQDGKSDFYAEEIGDGNMIEDAINKRNEYVADRLKVNFTFEIGTHNTSGDFVSRVAKNYESGTEYDLLGGYTRDIASCAINGYVRSLSDLEYTNLDNPWWPENLKEQSQINGKLYFASGDIAPTNIQVIGVVFFNKTMIGDLGYEDPYKLVEDGTWTLEKMFTMASGVYKDDGDTIGVRDKNDTYGYMTNNNQCQQLYWGSGMRWVTRENEKFVISEDFLGEKMENFLGKLTNLLYNDEGGIYDSNGVNLFAAGKALFITNNLDYSRTRFAPLGSALSYGMVPAPKWDESQLKYYASVGNAATLYAIPVNVKNLAKSDATLEALASYAYRSVSPVVCQVVFSVRYAPDAQFGRIFDILRRGLVYEPGRIFHTTFGDAAMATAFNNCVSKNNPNFISFYAPKKEMAQNAIDSINGKLE